MNPFQLITILFFLLFVISMPALAADSLQETITDMVFSSGISQLIDALILPSESPASNIRPTTDASEAMPVSTLGFIGALLLLFGLTLNTYIVKPRQDEKRVLWLNVDDQDLTLD